jgi:hypothetical protein
MKRRVAHLLFGIVLLVRAAPDVFGQNQLQILTLSLPNGSAGTAYAIQVQAIGGTAPYVWSAAGTLPPGLSVSLDGVFNGTPILAGVYSFNIRVTDSSNLPQTSARTFTLKIAPSITTTSLPNGAEGLLYPPQKLTATPGLTSFTWYAVGSLPNGLSLSSDGTISGTPTASGKFDVEFDITDNGNPPLTASKVLTITIQPRLKITTASSLPLGVVGAFYLQSLLASGPSSPVTWTVVANIPPPGLGLSTTGSLAGSPTVAGTFDFTIQATAGDPVQTVTQNFRIVVNGALTITTLATLPSATVGTSYTVPLAATGGVPSYTWSLLGGGMPPGLSLSSSGVISGVPMSPGQFVFVAQVSDSFNPSQQVNRTFGVVVNTAVTITTTTLPNAIQNVPYSQQLQAIGVSPFAWVVTGGTLPSGLTLNLSGLLQGTPTIPDSKMFTVTVTDSRGSTSGQTFTLVVDPPLPSISAAGLPASLNPTQSSEIHLSLDAPHSSALSGQLALSFLPKAEVPVDDVMTRFSSGSRSVSFTIPANSTTAVFPFKVVLLTGTVAGTVRLAASIDNGPSDMTVALVDVLAIAPQITNLEAVRTPTGLDVLVTGYAPARRVTNAEFIFDVKNAGKVILSKNVDSDFSSWFHNVVSVVFGSSFSFVQSFSVQGDSTAVEAVTLRLANAQGSTSSNSVRVR